MTEPRALPVRERSTAPKLYADTPVRRAVQLLGDAFVVLWVLACLRIARAVHSAVLALSGPGRQMEQAGTQIGGALDDAGNRARGVPFVGDALSSPLTAAADASDRLADAGRSQQDILQHLAVLLFVIVFLMPVLWLLGRYLPPRIRWVREATAVRRMLRHDDAVVVLATRAMVTQPMHRLARLPVGTAQGWLRGDDDASRRLAALELSGVGLRSEYRESITGRP